MSTISNRCTSKKAYLIKKISISSETYLIYGKKILFFGIGGSVVFERTMKLGISPWSLPRAGERILILFFLISAISAVSAVKYISGTMHYKWFQKPIFRVLLIRENPCPWFIESRACFLPRHRSRWAAANQVFYRLLIGRPSKKSSNDTFRSALWLLLLI